MDINQLHYFILVAKHLNFTAAAKEAHIDQSALSKQIAELEAFLGLKLFIRNTRSVRLTAAGSEFLTDAIEILAKIEKALTKVRQISKGSIGNLRIGFTGAIELEKDKFPAFIKKFRSHNPNVDLSLVRLNLGPLLQALTRGDLDIIFTFSPEIEDIPDIKWEKCPLYPLSMPMCVVVPMEHAIANYDKINLAELAQQPFVVLSLTESPSMHNHLHRLCISHGFHPNITSEAPLLENLLLLIETGIGISILSRHTQAFAGPNLRFIEIENYDFPVDRVVAWKKANPNPLIPLFLDMLNRHNLPCYNS